MTTTRPNLATEAKARRGCRNNLAGLRCRDSDGKTWTIRSTIWAKGMRLMAGPQVINGPLYDAASLTLVDPWPPSKCCRSRLDSYGQPFRRKGGRR